LLSFGWVRKATHAAEQRSQRSVVSKKSLAAPDLSDAKLGTSVHAVALRHIVQIHASFFDYYDGQRKLGKQGAASKAKKELEQAVEAKDRVLRLHPHAQLGTGESVMKAVERDVLRLTGGRRR
jgi:hypothetical protein